MMFIFLYLCLPYIVKATTSRMYVVSQASTEYLPIDSIQLLLDTFASRRLMCVIECHKQWACRTLDYDSVTGRCRLYEGDLTTGSIVASSLSNSIVMSVVFTSAMFASIYNQPCQACTDSRYGQCINNICQCPPRTYWNGNQCLVQLFENQACTNANGCRKDLSLTCIPCYQDLYLQCSVVTLPVGTTVAGDCNGVGGSTNTMLYQPRGIAIINNGTELVVAEEGNTRVQKFSLLQRNGGSLIMTSDAGEYPSFVMAYNNLLYISIPPGSRIQIWPSNTTIPPLPPFPQTCSSEYMYGPMGLGVDSSGAIYVANQMCHWVTRWAGPNTSGVAGIASTQGGTNDLLGFPSGIYVNQPENSLYVADFINNRIQKFNITGDGIGVTVAGGNGAGAGAHQLNYPADVTVSRLNGAVYIADLLNNRVQRWDVNAVTGVTVAGDPGGAAGVLSYTLNGPFAVALDPINEAFIYVSDYNNNRVLRFPLT